MLLNEIRLNQIKNDAAATAPKVPGQEIGNPGAAAGASSLFSAYVDTSNTIFTKNGLAARDTVYGKKDLAEDALQNALNTNTAAMSDTAMKNQMVARATADLSAGDVQAAGQEGFDYRNMNPEELVTVGDKIRLNLAKAGVDVSKFGGVSDAAIAEGTGNAAQAAAMKKALENAAADARAAGATNQAGAAVSDSASIDTALSKAREITEIPDKAALYLIRNNMAPTIDNVYRAVYGAGEEEQAVSQAAIDQVALMDRQVGSLFGRAGLTYDDNTRATAAEFLQNEIPLTFDNINKFAAISTGDLLTGQDLRNAVMNTVASGSEPGETLIIAGLSATDMAENAAEVINNATPEDVTSLVSSGKDLNVINLAKTAAENAANAKEQMARAGRSADALAAKKAEAARAVGAAMAKGVSGAGQAGGARTVGAAMAKGVSGAGEAAGVGVSGGMASAGAGAAEGGTKSPERLASEIEGYARMNGGIPTVSVGSLTEARAQQALTQARLIMTSSVNYNLLQRGINISTTDISNILTTLQQQEEAFYSAILGADEGYAADRSAAAGLAQGSAPASLMTEFAVDVFSDQAIATLPGRIDVYNTTNQYVSDFAAMPLAAFGRMAFDTISSGQAAEDGVTLSASARTEAAMQTGSMSSSNGGAFEIVHSNAMTRTLAEAHEIGASMQNAYEKAGEAYETMGTRVREDLGDSIDKAFSNVADILSDLGFEDTQANEKAVRILGYNSMDITKENILTVREAAEEVERTLKALKPAVVAGMIRDGKNPLNMSLAELSAEADRQQESGSGSSADEQFAKFIWKAERSGDISADEKESMIGIARLINQVEKSDGAVIGRLLSEGREITLSNMLGELRSMRKGGIDYSIDDDFSGLDAGETEKLSISQQIEKGFQTARMKDAGEAMTPGRMAAVGQENYMPMTPDAFAAAMENFDATPADAAAEEAYAAEEAQEVRDITAMSEEQAYSMLERMDIPQTPAYLEAINTMMANTGDLYRRLFGLAKEDRNIFSETNEKAEGKTIEDVMADLIRDYGEAVKAPEEMAEAQEKLADLAEHAMDGMIVETGTKSVDVRSMQLLQKEIKIMGQLGAKGKSYEIPVLVADQYGTMQLRIMKGEDKKGLVELSFLSEKLGNMRAAFQYEQGFVSGAVTTDSADTRDRLAALSHDLISNMQAEAGVPVDVQILHENNVAPVDIFETIRNTENQAEEAPLSRAEQAKEYMETSRLFSLARAFIHTVSEAEF